MNTVTQYFKYRVRIELYGNWGQTFYTLIIILYSRKICRLETHVMFPSSLLENTLFTIRHC